MRPKLIVGRKDFLGKVYIMKNLKKMKVMLKWDGLMKKSVWGNANENGMMCNVKKWCGWGWSKKWRTEM